MRSNGADGPLGHRRSKRNGADASIETACLLEGQWSQQGNLMVAVRGECRLSRLERAAGARWSGPSRTKGPCE